jgi:hypothetical protein
MKETLERWLDFGWAMLIWDPALAWWKVECWAMPMETRTELAETIDLWERSWEWQ